MTTGRYIINTLTVMTQIFKKLSIKASQQKVWDVISDLGGVQNYSPGVKKSFYNTKIKADEGAGRICELHPMGKVEETAVKWNDGKNYTLHIKPIEKLPFFKEGFADFSLSSDGSGGTTVEVDFNYTVKGGPLSKIMNTIALKKNFDKAFVGVLKGLKKHIEEGEIIETGASLKGYNVSFA